MKKFCCMLWLNILTLNIFANPAPELSRVRYEVDLNDLSNDLIGVTVYVAGLTKENAIFQFAATAPGTYQVMDIGRYVRSIQAFDRYGRELNTARRSTNQWEFLEPQNVYKIRYKIAETWDTPVSDHQIFSMCGTSLEEDHLFLNGHAVFGYPSGLQDMPIMLKLPQRTGWQIGTALKKDATGNYLANNYGELVDSPILAGNLSKATTTVAGAQIDVYTYSKAGSIPADLLLNNMRTMLQAAGRFMGRFPVSRYTFLFHFGNKMGGGWEHNYSSGYVIKEEPFTKAFADRITYLSTHEFLHIITPLHIHSDAIQPFDFVTPSSSEHLWLYEGVTEWASHMMALRGKMIDLDTYFDRLSSKIKIDRTMDTTMSLSKISLTCYLPEGQQQSWNIYNRGALVAGLLDIRLLELSNGKRGLREVLGELIKKYGPERSFSEKKFFALLIDMTYPEIGDFVNSYIRNTEPLPIVKYYSKLGICYTPALATGKKIPYIGLEFKIINGALYLSKLTANLQGAGLRAQDRVIRINDNKVDLTTPQGSAYFGILKSELENMKSGQYYTLTILRNEREETIACRMLEQEEIKKFVFRIDPAASVKQVNLRRAWLKNLPAPNKPRVR
jgi:predicted metalloprotease with PDZ domain